MKMIYKILNSSITLIFTLISLILFIMCMMTNCYINSYEHTYFVNGKAISKAIVLIGFLVCVFYIHSKKIVHCGGKAYKWILLCIICLEAVIWVIGLKADAVADQSCVMDAATNLLNGVYNDFMPGGYVAYYTNQIGLVTIEYYYSKIFGEHNYLIFQLFNALFIMLIWKELYDLSDFFNGFESGENGENDSEYYRRNILLIVGIMFLPLIQYATFVYGTIIGFAFALISLKYIIKFINTNRARYIILSCVFIALSVMSKTNYVIFLVAMVCLLGMDIIKKMVFTCNENIKEILIRLAAIIILVAAVWGQGKITKSFIENRTGQHLDNGMASVAWLKMGLDDGGIMAPGWYNGYNIMSYMESGGDSEVQRLRAMQDTLNIMRKMKNNVPETARFFAKKTASQWLNPTYQAVWNVQQTGIVGGMRTKWASYLISPDVSNKYSFIYSYVSLILFFGMVCYGMYREDTSFTSLFFMITYIGGFIFHLFWEAKAQYTIVYAVIAIPLAVRGILYFVERWSNAWKNDVNILRDVSIKEVAVFSGITVISFLTIMSSPVSSIFRIDDDTQEFNQYKAFFRRTQKEQSIDCILTGNKYMLRPLESDSEYDYETHQSYEIGDVHIIPSGNNYRIKTEDDLYLSGFMFDYSGCYIDECKKNDSDCQLWNIDLADDGQSVYIYLANRYALTYDDSGKMFLSEYEYRRNQQWIIGVK